jgi:hypothetical protein
MEGQSLMRELGTIFGGIGMLIFVYLLAKNASGVSTVAEGLAQASTSLISTLQGNASTGLSSLG